MKRFLIATVLVLAMLTLAACAPGKAFGPSLTPTPTITVPYGGPTITPGGPSETPTWTATATPTATMTATETQEPTIAPPDLPAEFFSAVPAGEYEVRTDGVYAPSATGEMRMWYEKQTDGSYVEVYFRWGEPPIEQKIAELASRLVCEQAETCISMGPYAPQNPVEYFEFISTGVAEKQAIFDTGTGEMKGYIWDMVVVSRDINQNPVVVRELLQLEHFDKPGINQYPEAAGYYFPEVGLSSELAYNVQEVDLYQKYLPEGRMRTFLTPSVDIWQIENYAGKWEELMGNFATATQREYTYQFITSGGVINEPNIVLWMFSEIERLRK